MVRLSLAVLPILLSSGSPLHGEEPEPVLAFDSELTVVIRDAVRTFSEGGLYADSSRERFEVIKDCFEEAVEAHEDYPLQFSYIRFPRDPEEGQPYLLVSLHDWRMRVTTEFETRLSATLYVGGEKHSFGIHLGKIPFRGNPSIRRLWDEHREESARKAIDEILTELLPYVAESETAFDPAAKPADEEE